MEFRLQPVRHSLGAYLKIDLPHPLPTSGRQKPELDTLRQFPLTPGRLSGK
jgi:hypothetical protein